MANQNRQNDEMNQNLGGQGREDEGYGQGQQAPGRRSDEESDQRTDDRDNARIGEDE